ncbi:DNA mismatch repair protein MutS [Spirochaetia bacterium]|nr:DNA mismatch repair protein MutS [Spirochaetia bacterium]
MASEISPMQAQYRRIKSEHSGEVLFFRLGDFYEMFADDAIEVSKLLNLTLTHRGDLPMCGVPYHSYRSYVARLLKAGKKIAICEQITAPNAGKTLIEREVVEVITPGTTIEEDFLEKDSSNYLACLYNTGKVISFSYIELSSAEFYTYCIPLAQITAKILQELSRLDIKEIIVPQSIFTELPDIAFSLQQKSGLLVNRQMDWVFDIDKGRKRLLQQFGVESLKCFGLDDKSPEIFSAGALLNYVDDTAKSILPHIRSIKVFNDNEFLSLDESTLRNLEILRNLKDGDVSFSLLEVCDHCKTSMGRRLLRYRLTHPLLSIDKIQNRLTIVEFFFDNNDKLNKIRSILAMTPDLQRQMARLAMNKSHGKDLLSLKNALYCLLNLRDELEAYTDFMTFESSAAISFNKSVIERLETAKDTLDKALFEEPSILFTEAKLIKRGYNAELDKLHDLHDNGRELLQSYLEEEKKKTGISNLKIHYNRLIGYFFEVNNNALKQVPPYFIKRQGLATAERYSTEKLAALESEINGAYARIVETERQLFFALRDNIKTHLNDLSFAAAVISELDVGASMASAARLYRWIKPMVNDTKSVNIVRGRHPVVEAHTERGTFIPNDLMLCADSEREPCPAADGAVSGSTSKSTVGGSEKDRNVAGDSSRNENFETRGASPRQKAFMLLTGPNMAGKSTYLRQAALIILMAQSGSFVPAEHAEIGIVDRVYCRVGASDNLARGESTFFVEMNETAYILNTATARSLVIMECAHAF